MSERGINLIFRDSRVQNWSQCSSMGGEMTLNIVSNHEMHDPPFSQPQISVCPVPLWTWWCLCTSVSGTGLCTTSSLFLGDCFFLVFCVVGSYLLLRIQREHFYPSLYGSESESRSAVSHSDMLVHPKGEGTRYSDRVAESCLTLCGPMDYTVHGILQARILGWVAFPFSRGSSWPRNQTGVSCNWAIREAWSFRLYTTPYLKDWVRGSVLPVLTPLWVLSHRILVVGCLVRTPCMRFMRVKLLSQVQLWMIPWTVACQAPLSMGYSSQEYWSGLPSTPPENLPNPGMEPTFLMSPALAGGFFTTSTTWETAWAP